MVEGLDVRSSTYVTDDANAEKDVNTSGMWTLDPIDGTKGFLRGEQYAVCLALLVDAQVQVSVMGCPNLPVDASNPDGPKGCLFIAVRGRGGEQVSTLYSAYVHFVSNSTTPSAHPNTCTSHTPSHPAN